MTSINIQNLTKKYPNKILFENSTVTFDPGIYWLTGNNGRGKSTLFDILAGLDKNISGSLTVNRQKLLYLTNYPIGLFSFTLSENLSILLKTFDLDISEKQKENINIFLENSLSDSYGTLSTGQKMKLGLSLVLLEKWDIILLDETFSTIDTKSRNIIVSRLQYLAYHNSSVIIYVSHGEVTPELTRLSKIITIDNRRFVYEKE